MVRLLLLLPIRSIIPYEHLASASNGGGGGGGGGGRSLCLDSHVGRLLRTAYRFEGEEQEQEEAHKWVSGLAC